MARKATAEKELDEMAECSICTEVFTDPRILPCIHTFCLKCLLTYGKDKQPRENMPCPLCRKAFNIPDDGLSGIQKNYFMEKVIHARKLSADGDDGQGSQCDVCSSEEAETKKRASMYCVQCQENYCEQCSRSHSKMKATADHVQVDAGKQHQKQELILSQPTICDIHKGKEIEVFCLECELAICLMCFIKSHKTHNCSDIVEVAADLRMRMNSDTDKASELLEETGKVLPSFEKKHSDFIKHLAAVEGEINSAADRLIAEIQYERAKRLSEVESIKQKRIKQLETLKEDVEQHMTALESLKRYSELLLSSGTDYDVIRSAKRLHDRAEELMKFDVFGHVDNSLPSITVEYKTSAWYAGSRMGTIRMTDEKPRTPKVTRAIRGGNSVHAVTSLENEVFVLRENRRQVEVYDDVNFNLQRRLEVPTLGLPSYGLAVCSSNSRLYASDFNNASVHRVELSGAKAVKKRSVAPQPVGVTVNNAGNVVVVSQGERKLQEFTPDGTLLRNIQLQADIERPQQALQVGNGKYLVSHVGSLHRVCLVDDKGAVIRSYGGQPGSDLTRMDHPRGLAVDRAGRILVADQFNDRLLVLDRWMTNAHVMFVEKGTTPYCLWYDKSRGRLYVGALRSQCRVILIDNLKDFTASNVKLPSPSSTVVSMTRASRRRGGLFCADDSEDSENE